MARAKVKFTPTADHSKALADYKEWAERQHKRGGPTWQNSLRQDFQRAGSRWPGPWHFLQQVRNRAGGIEWALGEPWMKNPEPTMSDHGRALARGRLALFSIYGGEKKLEALRTEAYHLRRTIADLSPGLAGAFHRDLDDIERQIAYLERLKSPAPAANPRKKNPGPTSAAALVGRLKF